MNQTEKFKCTLTRLFTVKPNGWWAGIATTKNLGDIKLSGVTLFKPSERMELNVEAYMKSSAYGDEYVIINASVYTKSRRGIVNYLASQNFPGIGKAAAQRIYDEYGDNTIVMIQNHPDIVGKDCNLTDKQVETLRKNSNNSETDIKAIFPTLTINQIKNIIKRYSSSTDSEGKPTDEQPMSANEIIDLIKKNPYKLLDDVDGIPFTAVDDIAINTLHFAMDDERRIRYVIMKSVDIVLTETGGNFINLSIDNEYLYLKNTLFNFTRLMIDDEWMQAQITKYTSCENALLKLKVAPNGETHLYTTVSYNAQEKIKDSIHKALATSKSNFQKGLLSQNLQLAQIIANLNKQSTISTGYGISQEQMSAINTSLVHQLSVITGGPGRGKTKTINDICCAWNNLYPHDKNRHGRGLLLCAPTGRAAKNLSDYTRLPSNTVDKLLCEYTCTKSKHALYEDKYTDGIAIVDECSMIGQVKMGQLLDMLINDLNMQVILVGDVNQLPPIEHGKPFKDIIDSGKVAVSRLTICFRTQIQVLSDIADDMLNGNTNIKWSPAFMVLNDNDETSAATSIKKWYMDNLQQVDVKDIAILCPVRTGESGVNALNMALQNEMNVSNDVKSPKMDKKRNRPYYDDRGIDIDDTFFNDGKGNWTHLRVGDRVMRTKNNYDIPWFEFDTIDDPTSDIIDKGVGVFNGELGTIIRYYPRVDKNKPGQILVLLDDNRVAFIECDPEDANSCHLTLAYASTIHKAQGCEYKKLIIACPDRITNIPNNFACRNILYTAVTRAKESLIIIGSINAINQCILTESLPRNSTLALEL